MSAHIFSFIKYSGRNRLTCSYPQLLQGTICDERDEALPQVICRSERSGEKGKGHELVKSLTSEGLHKIGKTYALLKNKFPFSHPIFRPSSPAPQSQNPQNISNIPAVLLNRRDQIWPKSGREKCEFISEQRLTLTDTAVSS